MAEMNRINSFKSFTEVKSVEKTNKLREENQAKRKQLSQKFESLLDELGITSYEGLDEETKKSLVSKLLGEEKNGNPKKVEEGNPFIYAASKAKKEGKDSFDFNGKTYKITLKADTGLKESVVTEAKAWELGKDYPTYGVVVGIRQNGDLCEVSFDSGNKIVFRDNGGEWVQESVVNEAKGFKNTKDFFSFLEEIDGMPESAIKKIMGKDYIDTPGGYRDEAEDYDNDIEEYMISNMGRKNYEKLAAWWENNVAESVVTESRKNALANYVDAASQKTFKGGGNGQNLLDSAMELASHIDSYTKGRDTRGYEEDGFYGPLTITAFKKLVDAMSADDIKNNQADKYESVVTESHFKIGDKVKCKDSGKTGKVVKLDKEHGDDDEKYYTVKVDGEGEMKYSPNELVKESVNEGAVKQFEKDIQTLIKNIKSGYGWIDPEFVEDTWENSSDTIDFSLVKAEIYKRLIAAKLLAYADDEDEEEAGQYIKSLKELGIKESVVNEEDITTDDQFKEYAMTVLKKAFGEDFDDAKAGEVVNGILKQADGDYGAAVGMLTSSLGESSITEAFDASYWEDYHEQSSKIKNPGGMQLQQIVSGCVEDWNDNNEDGENNEVTLAGEKKVLKLAKKFVKAKGWISDDVIDAIIAQES